MMSQPPVDLTSPVTPSATFDPPVVRPGEQTMYRVTFNALEESIAWPEQIAAPSELDMRPGARGQILQMTGAGFRPMTAFNYRVRASKEGQFTVPEFVVQANGSPATVPAARLEIVAAPPAAAPPAPRLILQFPMTNLFVGQAVAARVVLPGSAGGAVQSLQQVQLTGQGFIVDPSAVRGRIERINRGGNNVAVFIYETTLTPIAAGKLTLFAQAFTAGLQFSGPVVISGSGITVSSAPQLTLLESDPVEIEAHPVPQEGQLPGFTGGIGSFALEPPKLSTNLLSVGEPVKLVITVVNRGEGNLARLVAPPPPRVREWQVFAPATEGASQGSATFSYTLIPLAENTKATPFIPFSYFDPQRGAYADLTIPAVPATVRPGAASAETQALLQTNWTAAESDQEPALSGLAASPGRTARSLRPLQQRGWFVLMQAAPAAALFGLWCWDRRRRFLEQHPDIVLRRRARRALRREWRALRQASRVGDAQGFAAAAVSAMRVACAPHFPAEPRALVGGDVLQVIREPQSRTGVPPAPWGPRPKGSYAPPSARSTETVRRFFALTDASRFATGQADATELLGLQPELEQVLLQLEDRL